LQSGDLEPSAAHVVNASLMDVANESVAARQQLHRLKLVKIELAA
jgi:hypothetical protein